MAPDDAVAGTALPAVSATPTSSPGGDVTPDPVLGTALDGIPLEDLAIELLSRLRIRTAGLGEGENPEAVQTVLDRLQEVWRLTAEGLFGKVPLSEEQKETVNEAVVLWLNTNINAAELQKVFLAGARGIAASIAAGKGESAHVAAHLA